MQKNFTIYHPSMQDIFLSIFLFSPQSQAIIHKIFLPRPSLRLRDTPLDSIALLLKKQ
jgi:hypothetical protein